MELAAFTGLKPERLWRHFQELTQIPRCSGNEAKAAAYVLQQAKSLGLQAQQDKIGNVVVRVPATAGREQKPIVVLQGHLDMVGEKDGSSTHRFDSDPISVKRDGDYLTAVKTTLGADNGIGLSAALALMNDQGAVHGPLELLFTVDEERGLTGAKGLKPGFVRGKILLNLDSEEEGSLYVGCAGGVDTLVNLKVRRKNGSGAAFLVKCSGLKGGHSGLDINLGRGNAIRILGGFLDLLRREVNFSLVAFEGGDKHNAIPREATAVIFLPPKGKAKADKLLKKYSESLKICFGKADPHVAVEMSALKQKGKVLISADRDRFLDLLLAMPHGVLAMSQEVPGLVETSTNMAVVRIGEKDSSALFHQSSRSSVMPSLGAVQGGIFALARLAQAKPEDKGGYPGWQPNMDSEALRRARAVYERISGKKAEVKAIHAGLECGIIGEKFGGMDMLSLGPQIEWPHSPSERVKVSSVERFFEFLKALLADLAA